MIAILKKYRTDIILGFLLSLGYFATRLTNLGIIPIFTDEAIYLRWSQIMAYDAALRYMPLVDGKPPLFMWATSVVMRLLPNFDPLLSGRLVSVGAGFLGMAGMYFLSYQLFKNKKISWLSALCYILIPFTFFYDRFALADSMLAMWGIWALGLGVMLVKSGRLDVAMILGLVIGFGRLTKTPAIFSVILFPVLLVLFDLRAKNRVRKFIQLGLLFVVAYLFSEMVYSILRLFPLFNMVAEKNMEFIITPREFLAAPFALLFGNLKSLVNWEFFYLTPLISLSCLFGVILPWRKNWRQIILLAGNFVLPLIAVATFNKVIYVRYLLTFTPALLVLAALGIYNIIQLAKNKAVTVAFLLLVFSLPLNIDFNLLFSPGKAAIPSADTDQYFNGWPAGYGVTEVRNYLMAVSRQNPKVVIGTEGTFGLMPYSLELYQKDYPNLEIKAYWPVKDKEPPEIAAAAKLYPTYFLIYQRPDVPPEWKVQLISSFRQGTGQDFLRLYKVLPD